MRATWNEGGWLDGGLVFYSELVYHGEADSSINSPAPRVVNLRCISDRGEPLPGLEPMM